MELALSLGDTPKNPNCKSKNIVGTDLGFCMDVGNTISKQTDRPPVQLDLLPFSPVHKSPPFPWLHQNLITEPGLNRIRADDGGGAEISSPNSTTVSSDLFILKRAIREKRDFHDNSANKMNVEADRSRGSSRGSDDELENGINEVSRKKLRLSKEQSAFLEESFKEHNTLNPKQKQALAKELNLRPRQVEVWFQNRRARTKLKKTEVDCEHLKRCCETLSQENRKLQKEINELRALKASSKPFYMTRPVTTLTMCPSCERVVPGHRSTASVAAAAHKPTKLLSL